MKFSTKVVRLLFRAGFPLSKVDSATDAELLAVKGFGWACLCEVRGWDYDSSPQTLNDRVSTLMRKHGVCRDAIELWLSIPRCEICGVSFAFARRSVDHCKVTGRIWGVLCNPCNSGIGGLQHDIELLERAQHYLAKGLQVRESTPSTSRQIEELLS